MKILYAEDNETERELTLELLKRRGFSQVEAVVDGKEAFKLLNDPDKPFDAVVTDHNMPSVTGLEVLKHLRHDGRLKNLPVIVCSADGSIKPVVESLGGIFVSKMGSLDKLFAELDKIAADIEKKKG